MMMRVNVSVNEIRPIFSVSFVVLTVDYFFCAVVARLSDRNKIATFFEKLAHYLCFVENNQSRHCINNKV